MSTSRQDGSATLVRPERLIRDRDRLEATTVTGERSGHQYELQLGHLCNNRCVFCSSGQLSALKVARAIPLEPIVRALEEARASGARRLTFVGGEPTIHKRFPDAVEKAVALGFEEIVIFTDGVMLPHPGFVERIVGLGGRYEWRISIQGGNEAAHVAVTGRRDSFRRILAGLEKLRALGQRVTANLCVNERSYRSLPDYPDLVRRHDIRQLHVDIVRPSSTGTRSDAYLRDIMPRYSTMAPYLSRMLSRFEREMPGFDVNVGNLPFCILPEWSHRIHHGGQETYTIASDEAALEPVVDKYEWHESMREHPPQCATCVFRPRCTGVFTKYLELYGSEEIQPVTRAQVAARDPERRDFALHVEPWLAPLVDALDAAPRGWRASAHPDPRARQVVVRCRAAQGRVKLVFQPPETEPAVLATRHYTMALEMAGAVRARAVAELLRWVVARLERADPAFVKPLDVARVRATLRRAQLAAWKRRRVDALVDRLRREAPAAGCSVGEAHTDGEATVVRVRTEAGEVDLRLAWGGAPDRPRLTPSFEVRADDPTAARPQLERLAALLRPGAEDGASPPPPFSR